MSDTEIRLSIPPEARFVALARVAAASLAAELDFTLDQIDELRMGANELVALLVEWSAENGGARVDLTYRLIDDGVELRGSVDSGAQSAFVLDELTKHILDAVTDAYDIGAGHGHIFKRRST